jgi:transposase
LNLFTGVLLIVFGISKETSDFWVDGLELWWAKTKQAGIKRLLIRLDNGSCSASNRRQWIKRLVAFADRTGLTLQLVYYPPYHSKYNPVERCWGIWEMHWNGSLLDSVETVLAWAGTMTWKATRPLVQLLEKVYETGVRLTKNAFKLIDARLKRDETLPKYGVRIQPQTG